MSHHTTSSFGRGWIPMDRDIGLPGGDPVLRLARPFTPERRLRFLHLLASTGNVRRACHAVGVSPQSAYVHKRRDGAFAKGWDAALILARDAAEEVLAERALHGTEETIFYRGEAVGSRVRFDARLLLAHLARLDRHHAEAEGAAAIAARFDDYLAELHEGAPRFEAPFHDPEAPPEWSPAHPTREETLLKARERALRAFPDRFEDLAPETREALEAEGFDKYDGWSHAFAQDQAEAEQSAAATWDHAAETRLAALDTLFEAEDEPDVLDPPHFHEVQMGRGTACEAGGGGGLIEIEPPIETKSLSSPRTVSTVSTCPQPNRPARSRTGNGGAGGVRKGCEPSRRLVPLPPSRALGRAAGALGAALGGPG